MMSNPSAITPRQMLAARNLLRWSRERLAAQSETTTKFVETYENTGRVMGVMDRGRSFDGLAATRTALEAAGFEFTNAAQPEVKVRRKEETDV